MTVAWPAGKRPVFVGAGWTMIRRYMPRTKASNAKEAATMAINDAGLKVSDIDGIFIWANPNWGNVSGPTVWLDVAQTMQVMPRENIKFWLQPEALGAMATGGVQCAALALGAGVVNYASTWGLDRGRLRGAGSGWGKCTTGPPQHSRGAHPGRLQDQ
jgi:hypothetical protein